MDNSEFDPRHLFEEVKDEIAYFDDGSLNTAYNAVDKHLETGDGNKTALIYESDDGKVTEFSFISLVKKSNKFANLLSQYGVQKGDRVFLFLPRIPELFISFLGVIKTGRVMQIRSG